MKRSVRTFSSDRDLVEQRRKEIVLGACRIFMKEGYDRTSMRELSKALKMSPGGIYHYIGSKEDILYLILEYSITDQEERLRRMSEETDSLPPKEALRKAIQIHFEDIDSHRYIYMFINHVMVNLDKSARQMMFDASERGVNFYYNLLQKGIDAGEFRIDDPQLYAFNIISFIQLWANRRWYLQQRYTLQEYAKRQAEFILNTICVV